LEPPTSKSLWQSKGRQCRISQIYTRFGLSFASPILQLNGHLISRSLLHLIDLIATYNKSRQQRIQNRENWFGKREQTGKMPLPNQVNTAYASFSSASREIASNGGAWNTNDYVPVTVLPHQSMGGMTDLIQLTGHMSALILIPSEIAQIGDTLEMYVVHLSSYSVFLHAYVI
jgi:hypothetical protein